MKAQRAVEQNLPRGGFEQIFSTHNFSDFHCRVVGHAGKLVTRNAIAPPDNKVAKIHARHKALRTQIPVLKLDGLAVRNAKTPVRFIWKILQSRNFYRKHPASTRIDWFIVQRLLAFKSWVPHPFGVSVFAVKVRLRTFMWCAERGL